MGFYLKQYVKQLYIIAAKPRKKATRLDIYENVSTSGKVENTDNRVNIETLLEYVMEKESQVKDDYQVLIPLAIFYRSSNVNPLPARGEYIRPGFSWDMTHWKAHGLFY